MIKYDKRKWIFVLVLGFIIFQLVACSNSLSGTYTSVDIGQASVTFEGDDVTISGFGIDINGKYEIKDDVIKITSEIFGQSIPYEYSFERKGNSIFLNGAEFKK